MTVLSRGQRQSVGVTVSVTHCSSDAPLRNLDADRCDSAPGPKAIFLYGIRATYVIWFT